MGATVATDQRARWRTHDGLDPVEPHADDDGVMADLRETLWAAQRPSELLETMRCSSACARSGRRRAGRSGRDRGRQAARHEEWSSTKDFLTAVTGGRKGAGRRLLALATAVTGDRRATGERWPPVRSPGPRLSRWSPPSTSCRSDRGLRDAVERLLLDEAGHTDATDLAAAGRRALAPWIRRGRTAGRARPRARGARRPPEPIPVPGDDGIGGVRLRGRGSVEDAAWLRSVLLPLAAPSPRRDRVSRREPVECLHRR